MALSVPYLIWLNMSDGIQVLITRNLCMAIWTFRPSIVIGGHSRMKLKSSHEARRVTIAKRVCDLFNRHIGCGQHLHRRFKAAVAAKFLQGETGLSSKQMAQPRDAQGATAGKISERARGVFIHEPNRFCDPEVGLNNFHKS